MVGKGLVLCLFFLSFFIITMISAASLKHSIERTNNGSECVTVPSDCVYGSCNGGECGLCSYVSDYCCPLTPGNCISPSGVFYGVCAPVCGWNDC